MGGLPIKTGVKIYTPNKCEIAIDVLRLHKIQKRLKPL